VSQGGTPAPLWDPDAIVVGSTATTTCRDQRERKTGPPPLVLGGDSR